MKKNILIVIAILFLFFTSKGVSASEDNYWADFCDIKELYCVDCGRAGTLSIYLHTLKCSRCNSLSLKSEYKKQCENVERFQPIKVGDWVKTTKDWNMTEKKIMGEVIYLKDVYASPNPIAVLKGGKEISTFWLEKTRTQRK